jgi:hypothetical protein
VVLRSGRVGKAIATGGSGPIGVALIDAAGSRSVLAALFAGALDGGPPARTHW